MNSDFKLDLSPTTCNRCGSPVTGVFFAGKLLRPVCDTCHKIVGKTNQDIEIEKRQSEWREICPPEMRFTDVEHKTWKENIEPIKQVLEWEFNKEGKGLVLGGSSGKCKTRSVWKLLKRLYINGVSFIAITETQFANECGSKFAISALEGRQWVDELCKTPLLFIDDIGKSSVTQKFSHELFHVIDKRTSWRRPTIATLNSSGKELESKLGESGAKIVRRLRDYCEIIKF